MRKYLLLVTVLAGCSGQPVEKAPAPVKDTVSHADTIQKEIPEQAGRVNDTLDEAAGLMAGTLQNAAVYKGVPASADYQAFSQSFSRRWHTFDSTRISTLAKFRESELNQAVKREPTLFYPFSGPDILYARLFFPDVEKYVLVGLEPVGTLPNFNTQDADSLDQYYRKINTSLNAILNFSFFRTESMSNDLRNTEVDGTIHLLFLFLKRTGNSIVRATPLTIDSTGKKVYMRSFEELKASKLKTKGVEILFNTPDHKERELTYFSVNAADYNLKSNPGFVTYMQSLSHFNVYLKGASYLLHKATFTIVRNVILNGATTIVQDDSGIALRYFKEDAAHGWDYRLYGQYSKPIKMFAKQYQPLLDSLYKQQGSKELDFGLGYNYRDKNSNFMVITKRN